MSTRGRMHRTVQEAAHLLWLPWLFSACVVTTHGGPGEPPAVPLTPEPKVTSEPQPAGPSQIRASHFLIAYRGAMRAAPYIERTKAEAEQLATELRTRALSGEDFSAICRENSDDRGSASQGGDLGIFGREAMVPAFSQAAFALPIAGISEIVETPFGFHVIQRTE